MMTKSLQKKRLEIVEQTFDETCLTLDDFCWTNSIDLKRIKQFSYTSYHNVSNS